jgi:hypothetical protein
MLFAVTGIRIDEPDRPAKQGEAAIDLFGEQDHIPVVDLLRGSPADELPVQTVF